MGRLRKFKNEQIAAQVKAGCSVQAMNKMMRTKAKNRDKFIDDK
jgi:hypothetical protein